MRKLRWKLRNAVNYSNDEGNYGLLSLLEFLSNYTSLLYFFSVVFKLYFENPTIRVNQTKEKYGLKTTLKKRQLKTTGN